MPKLKAVIQGRVFFREGKRWKARYCVLNRLTKVADLLRLFIFKDEAEYLRVRASTSDTAYPPVEDVYGYHYGLHLDNRNHVVLLVCHHNVHCIAFESFNMMQEWADVLRLNLKDKSFYATLVRADKSSKLQAGQEGCLHVQQHRVCFVSGPGISYAQPKLLMAWDMHDIVRFGLLPGDEDLVGIREERGSGSDSSDGRGSGIFCVEGGDECKKGRGMHLFRCMDPEQLTAAVDANIKSCLPDSLRNLHLANGGIPGSPCVTSPSSYVPIGSGYQANTYWTTGTAPPRQGSNGTRLSAWETGSVASTVMRTGNGYTRPQPRSAYQSRGDPLSDLELSAEEYSLALSGRGNVLPVPLQQFDGITAPKLKTHAVVSAEGYLPMAMLSKPPPTGQGTPTTTAPSLPDSSSASIRRDLSQGSQSQKQLTDHFLTLRRAPSTSASSLSGVGNRSQTKSYTRGSKSTDTDTRQQGKGFQEQLRRSHSLNMQKADQIYPPWQPPTTPEPRKTEKKGFLQRLIRKRQSRSENNLGDSLKENRTPESAVYAIQAVRTGSPQQSSTKQRVGQRGQAVHASSSMDTDDDDVFGAVAVPRQKVDKMGEYMDMSLESTLDSGPKGRQDSSEEQMRQLHYPVRPMVPDPDSYTPTGPSSRSDYQNFFPADTPSTAYATYVNLPGPFPEAKKTGSPLSKEAPSQSRLSTIRERQNSTPPSAAIPLQAVKRRTRTASQSSSITGGYATLARLSTGGNEFCHPRAGDASSPPRRVDPVTMSPLPARANSPGLMVTLRRNYFSGSSGSDSDPVEGVNDEQRAGQSGSDHAASWSSSVWQPRVPIGSDSLPHPSTTSQDEELDEFCGFGETQEPVSCPPTVTSERPVLTRSQSMGAATHQCPHRPQCPPGSATISRSPSQQQYKPRSGTMYVDKRALRQRSSSYTCHQQVGPSAIGLAFSEGEADLKRAMDAAWGGQNPGCRPVDSGGMGIPSAGGSNPLTSNGGSYPEQHNYVNWTPVMGPIAWHNAGSSPPSGSGHGSNSTNTSPYVNLSGVAPVEVINPSRNYMNLDMRPNQPFVQSNCATGPPREMAPSLPPHAPTSVGTRLHLSKVKPTSVGAALNPDSASGSSAHKLNYAVLEMCRNQLPVSNSSTNSLVTRPSEAGPSVQLGASTSSQPITVEGRRKLESWTVGQEVSASCDYADIDFLRTQALSELEISQTEDLSVIEPSESNNGSRSSVAGSRKSWTKSFRTAVARRNSSKSIVNMGNSTGEVNLS